MKIFATFFCLFCLSLPINTIAQSKFSNSQPISNNKSNTVSGSWVAYGANGQIEESLSVSEPYDCSGIERPFCKRTTSWTSSICETAINNTDTIVGFLDPNHTQATGCHYKLGNVTYFPEDDTLWFFRLYVREGAPAPAPLPTQAEFRTDFLKSYSVITIEDKVPVKTTIKFVPNEESNDDPERYLTGQLTVSGNGCTLEPAIITPYFAFVIGTNRNRVQIRNAGWGLVFKAEYDKTKRTLFIQESSYPCLKSGLVLTPNMCE